MPTPLLKWLGTSEGNTVVFIHNNWPIDGAMLSTRTHKEWFEWWDAGQLHKMNHPYGEGETCDKSPAQSCYEAPPRNTAMSQGSQGRDAGTALAPVVAGTGT